MTDLKQQLSELKMYVRIITENNEKVTKWNINADSPS